ncbi:general transcription factor II-I repeat domain-containing protein 2-like [Aphis craccivora]|uniref:General transcription factor II-I repeat domain-containing protein 2-like n=1 Tax=Aphis craccivora TaxID=307492 RepID=A0A6G0ZB08_APHCR|nr:general transcription factor II-I repeat domain-containing protein 2-like [Aphis craccivora]
MWVLGYVKKHFTPSKFQTQLGCFKYSPSNKRKLKPIAVPIKYLTPLKANCQDHNKFEVNEPGDIMLEVECLVQQVDIETTKDKISRSLMVSFKSNESINIINNENSIEKEHEETKKCLAVVQEKNEILKMNFQEKVSRCFNDGISMDKNEKLVSLSFDEVYISHDICYDKISEQVTGPQKIVQVVNSNGQGYWKQVVYYNYDIPMTSDILLEIITKLYSIGYTVVSVKSDMGPTNMGLWKSMNVSHTNR